MRQSNRNPVEVTAKAIAHSKGDRAWRNYLGAANAAEQVLQGPVNECLSRVFSSPRTLARTSADCDEPKPAR